MAIVLDEPENNRKSKQKKLVRKRKLLHEKVEVRSVEDGFLGSWHSGTVIAFDKQVRHVKYDHLLTDDGSQTLVDIVGVSAIVDGSSCVNMNHCNYRGCLRPVPPPLEFGKWDLSYGLCVDVYYQDAWWEGVVFDRRDGLEERRIFFPDLGDEMTIGVDSMRITQDWNEFTETWHPRGTWLFLELVEEYEQEQYVPVSVKQIWYDLREKPDFKKLEEWTSSARALWEDLVLQVIEDNLKITVNYFLRLQALSSSYQQETQPMLGASKCSSCDADAYSEGDCADSQAVVLVENPTDIDMINPESAVFQPAQEESDMNHLVSIPEDDELKVNILTRSSEPCQDKAICVEPLGLPNVSSVTGGISGVNYIAQSDKMNNETHRTSSPGNVPRAKVHYRRKTDQHSRAEGRITRDGIKCSCCGKVYSLSSFEVHAGSTCHRPSANIFLLDGRSLLDCQRQAIGENNMRNKSDLYPSLKGRWRPGENDHICSICHYGGELILCDQCPSSFHKSCLGLKDVPDGDWFCPSCCCGICKQTEVKKDALLFKDDIVVTCVQCQHKYHLGCLQRKGLPRLETCAKDHWFCGKSCEEVFLGLHRLLGEPIPVGADNLTWTLVKPLLPDNCELDVFDTEVLIENQSKLNIALGLMHECFEPVKEPYSQRDLIEDVIFGRGSELNRLNFRGFYTVLLERNDELITVATVRVYGKKVAEVPLVGTRFQYRRLGMCRILMNKLEKMLMNLGIEKLVLPAVPSVLNTWTASFGFSKMTTFERLKFVDYSFLDFQDTVMCQKTLTKSPSAELSVSRGNQSDNILRCSDSIDLDGSTAILEVFQAEQTVENRNMDGQMETSAGCESNGHECPLHLVDMTNQHTLIESKPCLDIINPECPVEDADFQTESATDRYAKCYRRRKILNLQSISFSI
ncbi:uncharacterized protein LOC110823704 [Carica papaya]|uniref:uncharacterized protein LOC110823704 n=1 Tax=Carica papaya TaxID=3649 RepID=UPI000B8D0B5E|nr:uncharacterized protein LOC110823704 [Carica papaya]